MSNEVIAHCWCREDLSPSENQRGSFLEKMMMHFYSVIEKDDLPYCLVQWEPFCD